MTTGQNVYRRLQQHLDKQPVGFPAVRSGADLRLLKRLFTPAEAELALHLSYQPAPARDIAARREPPLPIEAVEGLLHGMFNKGSIGKKQRAGEPHWYLVPMVIGMYEGQDGQPSLRFLKDAGDYMQTLAYARSLLSAKPPQMRTIPVNKSIPVQHRAASHDEVQSLIAGAKEPFVIVPCICRESSRLRRKPCRKTTRKETCLASGDMAEMVLGRGHGRRVSREEALAILAENEEDGLVFQPSGVAEPQFICSCCGCCCGMLNLQKRLPHPLDFWASSYYAEVSPEKCSACGRCIERCQVNAIALRGSEGKAAVKTERCIGCGPCDSTCGPEALRLLPKKAPTVLPRDEEALFETIKANKRSRLQEYWMMLKIVCGLRQ